jgi:hypothetical protein
MSYVFTQALATGLHLGLAVLVLLFVASLLRDVCRVVRGKE